MSWSKHLKILSFSAAILAAVPLLAACTLTPVYSGKPAETGAISLAYARPASRLEQIVYQELSLRFGTATVSTAPLATVSVSSGAAALVNTTSVNPNTAYEVAVTATLTITARDGSDAKPTVITRRASAGYQQGAQIMNDQFAYTEASERAAKAAAESLRLAILATLSR